MIEEAMTTEDWHVNGINVMHDYRERNSEFFDPSNAYWMVSENHGGAPASVR